jgi:hypothetical protein
MRQFFFKLSSCSCRRIAIEYASSPVEQPAHQTRTLEPNVLLARIIGRISVSNFLKIAGSLKKFVTPMSRS